MDTNDNITVKKLPLTKLIEKYGFDNLTPEIDLSERFVEDAGLTRPALQLAGFYDYFNSNRVQIIGNAEYENIKTLEPTVARERYDKLTSYHSPCIIYARGLEPDMGMIAACHRNSVPLFTTPAITSTLIPELTRYLGVELAPTQIVHGVLLDVYGEGVLITGDSGIGKSEVALDLISRGHRLVADDAVELHKVSEVTLVGNAPDLTRNLLELRGIGVLDIRRLFGVESVKQTQTLTFAIELEEWDGTRDYDHLGLTQQYTSFMDNRLPVFKVPIRPGRNVAIIVESAAISIRAKRMGFDAAKELMTKLEERGADPSGRDLKSVLDYGVKPFSNE